MKTEWEEELESMEKKRIKRLEERHHKFFLALLKVRENSQDVKVWDTVHDALNEDYEIVMSDYPVEE